jgi:anti-sigma factor RsiW
MSNEALHTPAPELLLFADGELPSRRASRVRAQLAACLDCRTRMAEIERTIADFLRIHHQALKPELPPVGGSRALLKTESAELAATSRWRRLCPQSSYLDFAFGLVLLLVFVQGAQMLYGSGHGLNEVSGYTGSLPNATLTPGLTRSVALAELCVADHDEVVRNVPSHFGKANFLRVWDCRRRGYGLRSGSSDHAGLRGAEDIRKSLARAALQHPVEFIRQGST